MWLCLLKYVWVSICAVSLAQFHWKGSLPFTNSILPHCLTQGEWNFSKPWQLYRQGFLMGSSPMRNLWTQVCVQRGAAWNLALPAGHPHGLCECWGASAVLTPAWSSQLGRPSWAHSWKGFLLQRGHSHKHNRADAKICLTGGRRVGELNSARLSQDTFFL